MTKKNLILFTIILLGGFFRFFKLSEYQIQLNHDEISQLYDTGSIVQTKKDIYGNFLPLVFPSTGDYKIGHYIYISTIPYYLLGGREVTIRVTSAFFGTLTILGVFLFVKVLTDNWIIAILSAALVAVTPSEIFYSRKSFENVIGVSLDFFGLFFLINGFKNKGKIYGHIGILLLSLAMYIYTSQVIIIPILILLTLVIFKREILDKRKYLLSLLLVWFILIIPLIFFTVTLSSLRFRAASVFISQDVNLGRVINLNENITKSYIDFVFLKFLHQFNPFYLFINGLDLTNQYILGIGPLLVWQFPFIILGAIFLIRNKLFHKQGKFLIGLLIISTIPSAITFEDYSPHRAMLLFTVLSIISSFGLYWLNELIQDGFKNKKLKTPIYILLSVTLFINVCYFLRIYIGSYPYEKSQNIQYPFKEVAQYAWSQYNNFNQIVFDPKFGEITPIIGVGAQYYLAYYGNYPPEKFQKEYKIGKKAREILFDKFSIREIYWPTDKDLKNTLIIASPWSVPLSDINENLIIKRFYFYDGKLAFYAIRL